MKRRTDQPVSSGGNWSTLAATRASARPRGSCLRLLSSNMSTSAAATASTGLGGARSVRARYTPTAAATSEAAGKRPLADIGTKRAVPRKATVNPSARPRSPEAAGSAASSSRRQSEVPNAKGSNAASGNRPKPSWWVTRSNVGELAVAEPAS
jgi:hypothetical protein